MRYSLISHPRTAARAITGVEVLVERPAPSRLIFSYWVFGDMDELSLPSPSASLRTDGLWRTTCFEAFLGSAASPAYRELNFSPSTDWAAYDFEVYRDPEPKNAALPDPPAIKIMLHRADRLRLDADICLNLAEHRSRLGLSAVIDERNGARSYWALSHPDPDKPDFHLAACLAGELPPAPAE
jgi:hypothetical protein